MDTFDLMVVSAGWVVVVALMLAMARAASAGDRVPDSPEPRPQLPSGRKPATTASSRPVPPLPGSKLRVGPA